jgi:hypothetical protein
MMVQTPRERAAEQRKLVWGGCQSVLGCGGLIALVAAGYGAVGLPLRSLTPGPDVIVFIDARLVQNELFGGALFGGVFFFLALARTKSWWGVVVVGAIFITAAVFVAWGLYSRVAAIAFQDDAVELRYVWPRPAARLEPHEIISVDWEQDMGSARDASELEYTLHLRTHSRHHMSFGDANFEAVRRTQQRIKALQGR